MIAHIYFDKAPYALPRGEHLGSNLRAFFGVKKTHDLFFEADQGDDILIEPHLPYFVDERDRFYSANRKINNS